MQAIAEGHATSALGFSGGSAACGLKVSGAADVFLVVSERECAAAAVFTRNRVVAAPVVVDQGALASTRSGYRAVIGNAGNANACTGAQGLADAEQTRLLTAAAIGCVAQQVLVLSTGVIGRALDMGKLSLGIQAAAQGLGKAGGAACAQAMMTTDTRPKHLAVEVTLSGGTVTLGGNAKGAGMIHPDMATMLAMVTTDAAIEAGELQRLLSSAVAGSFNCISIDGDTSTNDTVLLLANGASGVAVRSAADLVLFADALDFVCLKLAQAIVRDGEGARRFVTVRVTGAVDGAGAHAIANVIATSPLVKTAFAGGDPNWGRIMAAAGRAGVAFDPAAVSLMVQAGGPAVQLLAQGMRVDYAESDAAAVFNADEFEVRLVIGGGPGAARVFTCDFTEEYVRINADYTT